MARFTESPYFLLKDFHQLVAPSQEQSPSVYGTLIGPNTTFVSDDVRSSGLEFFVKKEDFGYSPIYLVPVQEEPDEKRFFDYFTGSNSKTVVPSNTIAETIDGESWILEDPNILDDNVINDSMVSVRFVSEGPPDVYGPSDFYIEIPDSFSYPITGLNSQFIVYNYTIQENESVGTEDGDEVYIRKDSSFHDWILNYANDFYKEENDLVFTLRNYINTDKRFIYFGKIYPSNDADRHIIFEGMKDYVKRALPPNNRKDTLNEFIDVSFDQNLERVYSLLKNVWTLRDPMEVDEKFLGYIARYFSIDIKDIPFDVFKQREVSRDLVYLLKEKGTFTAIYTLYRLFAEENDNILSIIEKWHTNDWSVYPKNKIFSPLEDDPNDILGYTVKDYDVYWSFLYAFKNWYRFSHIPNISIDNRSQWSYNPDTDVITSVGNTPTLNGIVSDKKYEYYDMTVTAKSTSIDNDAIAVVIAFATDDYWYESSPFDLNKTKKEHTLTAVRSPGGVGFTWRVYYNYRHQDQKLISDITSVVKWGNGANGTTSTNAGYSTVSGTGWSSFPNGTKINIIRNGNLIECKTSNLGETSLIGTSLISIDLESDPVLEKFIGPQRIGFSVYSQDGSYFDDVEFSGSESSSEGII